MSLTMNERARAILHENDRGGYTIPTKGLYPYQWNWDSAFAALGIATFDLPRAWEEIDKLVEAQWPDGMIPHILFRVDEPSYFPGPSVWQGDHGSIPSSGISQPPVLASVVARLGAQNPARAAGFFQALDAWHRWWHKARDPQGLGMIAISHPWESGRDNLPDWDTPGDVIDVSAVGDYTRRDTALVDGDMRPLKKDYDRYLALVQFGRDCNWDYAHIAQHNPFFVADPGITAILLRAERDLCTIARWAHVDTAPIEARIARLEAGMERLWNADAGGYTAHDMRTDTPSPWCSAASFLAFYAGVRTHEDALLETLEGFASKVRYMVPSFDPRDAQFDPIRYWRGPVWGMINYMIGLGLAECGHHDWAERVRRDTRDLIQGAGFAEYFSPLDGQGCGGGTFSWTAAIWLAWELEA